MTSLLMEYVDTRPMPKVTVKLPRVQFVQPTPTQPILRPLNVLDARLRVDAVQRTLLTRLSLLGGRAEGTLDELHARLCMPVTRGDLYALFEQGYVSLGYDRDVWVVEVRAGG